MEKQPPIQFPKSVVLACSLLCLVLITYIMHAISSILLPVLFSILFAICLYPITRKLEKIGLGRAFSSLLSILIASVLLGTLIYYIIHQVIIIGKDGTELQGKFLEIFDTIQTWIQNQFGVDSNQIVDYVRAQTDKIVSYLGGTLSTAFGSIGSMLTSSVLVPLMTFFLLYYRTFFREFFFKAFESTPNVKVNDVLNKIYDVVQSYLMGLILVMGIVAILNTVGLYILGVQYAWFFGTLAALLMLLPYIGIAIGSILPAIFALATKDSAWYALGVIAWFQVVQFLEGNFITPNIVGSKVSINPLMAIISIFLGGMLFGIAGLILALPLTATIKVILDHTPGTQAFGFLIGEPEKRHLSTSVSTIDNLKGWGIWDKLDNRVKNKLRSKNGIKNTEKPEKTDKKSEDPTPPSSESKEQ